MSKTWFSIENKADKPAAEIFIFDEIGFWGVTAKEFASQLKGIEKDRKISLRINSPGGSVFDGTAVYNMIADRRENVVAYIDGLAASMASVIAMAAGKVVMADNSMMMIHDPIGAAYGGSEDLRKMADVLDKIGGTISGAYEKKTGKTEADVKAAMAEETWFTAQEAKDWGLADEISGAVKIAATFDLQRFRRSPVSIAARAEGITPAATTTQKDTSMKDLLKALADAKLIPSAKLDDSEAAAAFTASFDALTKARKTDADTITSLNETIAAGLQKEADAFVASLVAAGKIKDDDVARKAMASTYLKDPAGVKAWTEALSPNPSGTLTPPSKVAGAEVKGATGNKIDSKSTVDPSLSGRDKLSALWAPLEKRN